MKLSATEMPSAFHASKGALGVIACLIKARLTGLVLLTALVGFYLGMGSREMEFSLLFAAMLGTGLLASGAAVLNQYLEREGDALMPRTQNRPIPAGQIAADHALIFGGFLAVFGIAQLAAFVNLLTSFLGAAALALYLFVYTPLKRVTSLNTVIGAVPGALPPLMGWTAARGTVDVDMGGWSLIAVNPQSPSFLFVRGTVDMGGWSLFVILFFWQLPHFLAIAWMYRDQYGKAGYVMLPNVDPTGQRAGWHALLHAVGLLPVSLFPFVLGLAGNLYFVGAFLLTLVFIGCAFSFARNPSDPSARRLFFYSILYLPLLLGLMVFDKTGG